MRGNTIKNKKLKKTLMLAFSFLPILSVCSYQNTNLHSIKQFSKKYALSDSRILNSKYSSLSAVNSQDNDNFNVSQEQLDHRITAIEDKTQYTLYAVGLKENIVDQTIGLMKKNISNKISEELANNNLPADGQLSQDSLNNVYEYVNTQAQMFGVSVIDFDRLQHDIPSMVAMYEIDLINAGVDKNTAVEQAKQYENDVLDTLEAANEYLYDDVTYSLLLNELQTDENSTLNLLKSNNFSLEEKQNNDKDAELQTVLSWFTSNSTQLLSLQEQGLSSLKDYSKNNDGLVCGDILSPDNISSLFNYKYNLARGCDFDQITIKDVPEAEKIGEYDPNVIAKTSYEAPLDTFVGYVPYEKNEVFPGYQLHVKILEVEDSKDSHVANLKFAFGISKTNDEYILWDKISKDKLDTLPSFSCNVNDFNLINNLTQNKYLNNKLTNNNLSDALSINIDYAELPSYISPNKASIFFDDTKESRTEINKILSAYKGSKDQDYDLKKNPVILDADAYKGIPVPSNINKLLGVKFHTNQEIALIADDVNTNINTLSIHWALIDKNIKENSYTNNDFYVVKDIPWHWNNIEMNLIQVQFILDKEMQKTINIGKYEAEFIEQYSRYAKNLSFLNQQATNDDVSRIEAINKHLVKCEWFLVASGTMNVTIAALIVIYSARVVATFGADADAITSVILGGFFLAASLAVYGLLSAILNQCENNYDGAKTNADLGIKHSSTLSEITNNYSNLTKDIATLNNSHAQYEKKVEAAEKIHKVSLKTRIASKSLLEDFIENNKEEIEKCIGKDEFTQEIHNLLYEDINSSASSDDDSDDMSKIGKWTIALTTLSVPMMLVYSYSMFSLPSFAVAEFDKLYEADLQIEAGINKTINWELRMISDYEGIPLKPVDQNAVNLINGFVKKNIEKREIVHSSLSKRKSLYEAHKAEDYSSPLVEQKFPIILTVLPIFQVSIDAVCDAMLLK